MLMCNRSGVAACTGRYLILLCQRVFTVPWINCVCPLETGMSRQCVLISSPLAPSTRSRKKREGGDSRFSRCTSTVPSAQWSKFLFLSQTLACGEVRGKTCYLDKRNQMKYLNETAPFEFSFHQYLKQQNLNLDLKTVTLGKKKKKREKYMK